MQSRVENIEPPSADKWTMENSCVNGNKFINTDKLMIATGS